MTTEEELKIKEVANVATKEEAISLLDIALNWEPMLTEHAMIKEHSIKCYSERIKDFS